MSREKSWIDYANLASNVIQNVQLQDLTTQVARQRQIAERQQYLEEEQNHRREALWAVKRQLTEVLEQYAEKPAQQMLILSKLLKNIDAVDSRIFDKWEDKERLEEIKKAGRQAFKDIRQKIGESETVRINNAIMLMENLPELLKKGITLIKAKESNEKAANELAEFRESLCKSQAQLIEKKNELESIVAAVKNPAKHKNAEKENELKNVEAQLAAIHIPAKHNFFKKAIITAAVLSVVSFIIFGVMTTVHPHSETPFVPTSSELIALTCFLCFFTLTIALPCFWIIYYNQLEPVKIRRGLKKTQQRLKRSLHNEQRAFLKDLESLKRKIQKEHESLLQDTTQLEEEMRRKKKVASLDTHREHLADRPIGQLYQEYADGVQECARVFGPEAKEYLEEMSVKAQKSILSV